MGSGGFDAAGGGDGLQMEGGCGAGGAGGEDDAQSNAGHAVGGNGRRGCDELHDAFFQKGWLCGKEGEGGGIGLGGSLNVAGGVRRERA